MSQEEIEITIAPDGKVTVATHGIKGADCLKAAAEIVKIIGEEDSRRLTAEYHEVQQTVKQSINVRQQRN